MNFRKNIIKSQHFKVLNLAGWKICGYYNNNKKNRNVHRNSTPYTAKKQGGNESMGLGFDQFQKDSTKSWSFRWVTALNWSVTKHFSGTTLIRPHNRCLCPRHTFHIHVYSITL